MVLVTGGSGLLGKELITQLLARGKSVIAIYNKTPLPNFHSSNLKQQQCNILDIAELEEIMQGVDQVYHCAAIVSFDPKYKEELFKINIEGTANVINAAINNNVKKIVHVSSVAALGRFKNNESVNETMNWDEDSNNSNYGKSKYLGELEVWRGIGEGLNAVIVNPSVILGAGDWNLGSSQIFKTIYNGFSWYSGGETGFVDVHDVAAAMTLLMDSNITAQRFILSAENRSYKDIFTLIAKGFNKAIPYKKATPLLSKIVWRVEAFKSFFTGKNSMVTKETTATALAKVNFDNSKLLTFLPGFKYKPLEKTIADTCEIFINKQ